MHLNSMMRVAGANNVHLAEAAKSALACHMEAKVKIQWGTINSPIITPRACQGPKKGSSGSQLRAEAKNVRHAIKDCYYISCSHQA